MKQIFTIIFSLIITGLSAQTFEWAQQVKGNSDDHMGGVGMDNNNNAYIVGFFGDTAYIGDTMLVSRAITFGFNIYLAKFDSSGNFLWARQAGSTSSDQAEGMVTDGAGNIYIAGLSRAGAIFGEGSNTTVLSNGGAFVAKYDNDGQLVWITESNGEGSADEISLMSDGSTYVTGSYKDTIIFGSIVLPPAPNSGDPMYLNNAFLVKFDPSGNPVWGTSATSPPEQYVNFVAVDNDNSGNVYVTGSFQDTAFFDGATAGATNGSSDLFIAKYNSGGTLQWLNVVSGTGGGNEFQHSLGGNALTVDNAGDIYVSGGFQSSVTFGTTTLNTPFPHSDMFLVKYNPSGNVIWALQSVSDPGTGSADLTTDSQNNLYVAGSTKGTATFGSMDANTIANNSTFRDGYVLKYDSNGNLIWMTKTNSATNNGTTVSSLVTNNTGTIYAAGYFDAIPVNIGSTALYAYGFLDSFLAKIHDDAFPTETKAYTFVSDISVFPNPTNGLVTINTEKNNGKTSITIYNALGKVVSEKNFDKNQQPSFDLSRYGKGVYFLKITSENNTITKRVVVN